MKNAIFLGVLVTLLSGCKALIVPDDYYEKECLKYGFKKDTDAFAQCLQKEMNPNRGGN